MTGNSGSGFKVIIPSDSLGALNPQFGIDCTTPEGAGTGFSDASGISGQGTGNGKITDMAAANQPTDRLPARLQRRVHVRPPKTDPHLLPPDGAVLDDMLCEQLKRVGGPGQHVCSLPSILVVTDSCRIDTDTIHEGPGQRLASHGWDAVY